MIHRILRGALPLCLALSTVAMADTGLNADDPFNDGSASDQPHDDPGLARVDCCGGIPSFSQTEKLRTDGIGGGVSVPFSLVSGGRLLFTTSDALPGGGHVLSLMDITDEPATTLGAHWPTNVYHHPDWSLSTLGKVFGLTMDGDGAVYVGATSMHGYAAGQGSLPGASRGTIFRIDPITAEPTVWADLPNEGPALGNLDWDCERRQMFATNLDDGLIYRLDASGGVASTFDHGASQPLLGFPASAVDGTASVEGARPFAVAVRGDRLYYSTWGVGNDTTAAPEMRHALWSIGLDGAGDFVGAPTLHLSQGDVGWPMTASLHEPVTDLTWGPAGTLMMAERTMNELNIPGAHNSRALEFEWDGVGFVRTLDSGAAPKEFQTGQIPTSAAGGAAYGFPNFLDSRAPDGRVWFTADAIRLDGVAAIYGLHGVAADGNRVDGAPWYTQGVLIDIDDNPNAGQKTDMGEVALTCPDNEAPPEPMECGLLEAEILECGDESFFDYTAELTNLFGAGITTVDFIDLPAGMTVTPSPLTLGAPLLPGQTTTVEFGIGGVDPEGGEEYCFTVSLHDEAGTNCCAFEHCIVVPECRECNNVIAGEKWNDANGNGVRDPGESTIPNWPIQIVYPDGTVVATVTDADGQYVFSGLPAGTYVVSEGFLDTGNPNTCWVQTWPLASGTTVHEVAFADPHGEYVEVDFGNRRRSGKDCLQIAVGDQDVAEALAEETVWGTYDVGPERAAVLREVTFQLESFGEVESLEPIELHLDMDRSRDLSDGDVLLGHAIQVDGTDLMQVELLEAVDVGQWMPASLMVVANHGQRPAVPGSLGGLFLGLALLSWKRREASRGLMFGGLALGVAACQVDAAGDETVDPSYRITLVALHGTDAETGHRVMIDSPDLGSRAWLHQQ